ncbi:MAG: hypothetical protein ABF636_05980 [Acetobacter sp.]
MDNIGLLYQLSDRYFVKTFFKVCCKYSDIFWNVVMTFNIRDIPQRFACVRGPQLMLVILVLSGLQVLLTTILAIPWGNPVEAVCRWDCRWYTDVVQNGYMPLSGVADSYEKYQENWAFFPLYPIISGFVSWGLGVGAVTGELLVNLLLWPVVIFLCCKDMELRGLVINRFVFCLFFVLYPMNIWYYSQYSEALYGVFMMGVVVALRSNRLNLACLLSFFLCLSRPTGFAMVVCLAGWWFFVASQPKDNADEKRKVTDRLRESALLVSVGGAGLSAFVLYLYHLTGDGFAFSHVEVAWGRVFDFFPLHIIEALKEKSATIYGIYALCVMVLLYHMWRKDWMLNVTLLAVTAFLGISVGVLAIERYIFANPLAIEFLAYGTLKLPLRDRQIILVGMGVVHVIFVVGWFMNITSLI